MRRFLDEPKTRPVRIWHNIDRGRVAMAGLTNTDLAADIGSAPSILRLFDAPGESPPSDLSSWDAAFLGALYQSDQNSRAQLVDIANRVARDVLAIDRPEPVQEH